MIFFISDSSKTIADSLSSVMFSYRIRFTVYIREHESDAKLLQIYESGSFEPGNVCGNFVTEKI